MITPDQQQWLNHLNHQDKGNFHPFNPESENIFQDIQKRVQSVLGPDIEVLHRGSSALGIMGQKEVDIYIPVIESEMVEVVEKLEKLFGIPPKSIYQSERIKFLQEVSGVRIEVMVVNKDHKSWIEGEAVFEYLKTHPEALAQYVQLKESSSGLTYKEYQTKKVEFFNKILGLETKGV